MRAIDPIDRTELLKKAMPKNPDAEFHCVSVKDIMAMPSAEPVRCKDCKHLFDDNRCPLRTWRTHTEDDFCSYGKRRME